jgi:hypothetical protein
VIEGEAWVLWDSSSSLLGFVHGRYGSNSPQG